jgi:hypothetical protein
MGVNGLDPGGFQTLQLLVWVALPLVLFGDRAFAMLGLPAPAWFEQLRENQVRAWQARDKKTRKPCAQLRRRRGRWWR